jgi:hypothetical protein
MRVVGVCVLPRASRVGCAATRCLDRLLGGRGGWRGGGFVLLLLGLVEKGIGIVWDQGRILCLRGRLEIDGKEILEMSRIKVGNETFECIVLCFSSATYSEIVVSN